MHAGDTRLLPYAEEALRQVHGCQILVNDLHASNVIIVPDSSKSRVHVFFVDFSLSQTMPSKAQCQDEFQALTALFQ
jgi:tRNA A-37 threonylcarbamoyl transferase component Bud32